MRKTALALLTLLLLAAGPVGTGATPCAAQVVRDKNIDYVAYQHEVICGSTAPDVESFREDKGNGRVEYFVEFEDGCSGHLVLDNDEVVSVEIFIN